MSIHHFNIKIAEAYGINEAIILQNLSFWQSKNEANEHNFHDGSYWVYNSVKAFEKLFPYWSKGQINRILKNLEDKGAVSVGNYNRASYDRTKWYSLKQEIHLLITGNGIIEIGKPIPDSKPDSKPDIQEEEILNYLNSKTGKSFRTAEGLKARLSEGFTIDDAKKVIDTKCAAWLHDPKMNQFLRPKTLFSNKFDSYLNEGIKPVKSANPFENGMN